jgi:hypothetical protein
MTAVLRVHGADLDVDGCLAWLPADRVEKVWHVGERAYLGRVSPDAGFNFLLSDAEDRDPLIREAVTTFLTIAENVAELIQAGATAEIDFALFVDAGGSKSIVFEPETLRTIEQYGAAIEVSAYPCAGDDEVGGIGDRRPPESSGGVR